MASSLSSINIMMFMEIIISIEVQLIIDQSQPDNTLHTSATRQLSKAYLGNQRRRGRVLAFSQPMFWPLLRTYLLLSQ
jgi:hypothetical protein